MNKVKRPKIGEYVLLSKFSDKDLNDPWVIGILEQIRETEESIWYKTDCLREFKYCWRLKKDEGLEILKNAQSIFQ